MLISGRHACIHLEGAGLGNRQARRVLASGLAGVRAESAWAHYYESETIMELVGRPVLDRRALQPLFPHGLVVVRRIVDLRAPQAAQRAELSAGWRFSPIYGGWISARLDRYGPLPLVATLGGFVVLGADVTGAAGDHGETTFRLADPGPWFDRVAKCRVRLGRGREWSLLGFPWPDPAPPAVAVS